MSAGDGCSDQGPGTVACLPRLSLETIQLALGDGDDSVRVSQSFPAAFIVGFRGAAGVDNFLGGPEADWFDPGSGADTFSGGAGGDLVIYSGRTTPIDVQLDGNPVSGNELDGSPGARDSLGTDVEDIAGGNAADRLVGNSLANSIAGFKGADVLVGLGGPDRLSGEDITTDFAVGGSAGNHLYGGRGRDFLFGTASGDFLFGGPGIDRIDASEKRHERVIDCGPGNDRKERATRDGGDPHPIRC
jgi:Ca2+-binding RTX toxin-like protein